MFTKSAAFYDAIYSFKDYAAESQLVRQFIDKYKRTSGTVLLDAACGTGQHARDLSQHYQVEGFDLDAALLEVARQRCPGLSFYQADMVDFDLGKQYDILTCLFSAVGYARTADRLDSTLRSFARHLRSGGVALVEPWIAPEDFHDGHLGAVNVDQPELKITRMNLSSVRDGISTLYFHYLVGTPAGVTYFTENHELGLFTDEQYRAAFAAAGLETHFDKYGLNGRGLYIGIKP